MTTNTYSQETEQGSQRKSQRLKSAYTSAEASSTTATTPNQEKKRTAPTNPEDKPAKKQQSNKFYQWDSKWPDPDTEVAELACAPTTAEQIQKAADLYEFVTDHEFQSNIWRQAKHYYRDLILRNVLKIRARQVGGFQSKHAAMYSRDSAACCDYGYGRKEQ